MAPRPIICLISKDLVFQRRRQARRSRRLHARVSVFVALAATKSPCRREDTGPIGSVRPDWVFGRTEGQSLVKRSSSSLAGVLAPVLLGALAMPAARGAEQVSPGLGFVVHMFHAATYSQPGQCPHGGNGTEREQEKKVLLSKGYSLRDTEAMLEGTPERRREIVQMRGIRNGKPANAVTFPETVHDPHIKLVEGKFAYGFDLDGKASGPGSFTDPETQQSGVDNGLFRVLGCYPTFDHKLPVRPQASDVFWDLAMNNIQAWLFVVSGADPGKDGPVRVDFYRATRHPERNRLGKVMSDVTYVVDEKGRSHGSLSGEIRNGELWVGPGAIFLEGELPQIQELDVQHAYLRFAMPTRDSANRGVYGWLGGYVPWYSLWYELIKVRGHYIDEAGTYYAFRRLADADPDPVTGENRRISSTFRIEGTPAFIVDSTGRLLGRAER